MEEIIIRILTLIAGLIAGWSLGYCFCEAVKPILLERHNEKMKKKWKESQKTWTYTETIEEEKTNDKTNL